MATKTVSVSLPHHLSQDEAKRRIETGVADLRKQFGTSIAQVEEHWDGNRMDFRFSVMGQAATGTLTVEPQSVRIDVNLPWMLALLADKVKARVLQQGTKLLE